MSQLETPVKEPGVFLYLSVSILRLVAPWLLQFKEALPGVHSPEQGWAN